MAVVRDPILEELIKNGSVIVKPDKIELEIVNIKADKIDQPTLNYLFTFLSYQKQMYSLILKSCLQIPEELGRLNWIRYLEIRDCPIREIPDSVGLLTSLKSLTVIGTEITKVPDLIRNLKKIKSLIVSKNRITQIPDWLGELKS